MIRTFVLLAAVGSLARATTPDGNANSECCVELLAESSLQGKVFLPESSTYDARLADYYSKNAALAPSCMVLPTSTANVATIAATIYKNQCQFGIRSGGHSAHANSNSVDKGVTIDFGYMNTTTYNAGDDSVVIPAGSTWGQVYETLDPYGVSVAGGRASPVGVGGFTTGGGYSFHANAAGWACDTVRNWEIVLANGTVINANARENADLWRAQKGASGNFGFVTNVEFDIQPTNKVWGGFIFYPAARATALFQAYVDFVKDMDKKPNSQALLGILGNETPNVQYLAPISENTGTADRAAFEGFFSIPNATSSVKDHTYADIAPLVVALTHPGWYSNWIVELYASNVEMLSFINEAFINALAKMRATVPNRGFSFLVELQPVTQSIVAHGAARGGNVLGLERAVASGPALMCMLSLTVETAELQDALLPLARELHAEIVDFADERGFNRQWRYAPYAWGEQDPLADYGAENIALIKAAADKYDPAGVFQSLRASGFKIPA
ncbi:prosolanapyrone-II oxidase [Microdochium nivale]|nr:prosolanapyrone-II oxidase [Microdochium nivale]